MSSDTGKRRRSAVALSYEHGDVAPRVVAKGYGDVAERIIEEARHHGVFVHDSPELLALLMNLDLDDAIPAELYLIIAELLVWLADLDREAGSEPGHGPLNA